MRVVFGILLTVLLVGQSAYGIAYFPPPLQQIRDGTSPENVTCTEGLEIVIKLSNGMPACVKPSSVAKLIERNWAVHVLPNSESYEFANSEFTVGGKYETVTESISYDEYEGFLARPVEDGNFPGIIMIHEWWGLNENMKETAEKLASFGYVVLAVDLFGEVATDSQKASQIVSEFIQDEGISNMKSAKKYLKENHRIEKVGSIGWCFGGGQSLNLALNSEMDGTVIYYGRITTDTNQLSKINWPVLGIFAELDKGIPVESVNEFEQMLNQVGVENKIIIYPGVDHAFANPTGERYAPDETADAWKKTLEFFENNLR